MVADLRPVPSKLEAFVEKCYKDADVWNNLVQDFYFGRYTFSPHCIDWRVFLSGSMLYLQIVPK